MKIDLKKLPDCINEQDIERFDALFEKLGNGTTTDKKQADRILSSVMRKAGFEMKETMENKKTRKRGRWFIGFAAAAALLTTCAVGAGAAYASSKGFETGLRPIFGHGNTDEGRGPFSFTEETEAAMNRISVREGEVIENTFVDIDVTFEGTVAYRGSAETILTIRRKDGEPFVTPEGYEWTVMISDSEYDLFGYQPPEINPMQILTAAEDGSLSMMIGSGAYSPPVNGEEWEDNGYPLKFGFTDLYLIPRYHEAYENGENDTIAKLDELYGLKCDLANTMTEVRENSTLFTYEKPGEQFSLKIWSGDPLTEDNEYTRKYNKLYDNISEMYAEMSAESYKGRYTVSIETAELGSMTRVVQGTYNGSDVTVDMDMMGVTIQGSGNFYEQPFAFNEIAFNGEPPALTAHYKNGGSTKLYSSAGDNIRGGWQIHYSAEEPLLVDEVEYMTIGFKKVNLADPAE